MKKLFTITITIILAIPQPAICLRPLSVANSPIGAGHFSMVFREDVISQYRTHLIEYLRLISSREYGRVEEVTKSRYGRERITIDGLIGQLEAGAGLIIEIGDLQSLTAVERPRTDSGFVAVATMWEGDPVWKNVPDFWDKDRLGRERDLIKNMVEHEKILQIRQRYMAKVAEMLRSERQDMPIGTLGIWLGHNIRGTRDVEGATVKDLAEAIDKGLTYTDGVLFLNNPVEEVLTGTGYSRASLTLKSSYEPYRRQEEGWNTQEEAEAEVARLQAYTQERQEQAKTRDTKIAELTSREHILDECDRIELVLIREAEDEAYDIGYEISRWAVISDDKKRVALAIVRNDEKVLSDPDYLPELRETDYYVFFQNLFNERLMHSLLHRLEGKSYEARYKEIFAEFQAIALKYKTQLVERSTLRYILNNWHRAPDLDKTVVSALYSSCNKIRDLILIHLLREWASAEPTMSQEVLHELLLSIIEEYFINAESKSESDIIDTLARDDMQVHELIRIGVMLFRKEGYEIERLKRAWRYGDVIKKCRLSNVKLREIDVPSVSLGRDVLRDLVRAIERIPEAIMWKVDSPIPVSVCYKRGSQNERYSVHGQTKGYGAGRGSNYIYS